MAEPSFDEFSEWVQSIPKKIGEWSQGVSEWGQKTWDEWTAKWDELKQKLSEKWDEETKELVQKILKKWDEVKNSKELDVMLQELSNFTLYKLENTTDFPPSESDVIFICTNR